MDVDVLISGAGPTGLMLADQLLRRAVSVMIIDRHAGPARETRALGVQARTLEIYDQLGIVNRALELGKQGTGANLWAQGRKMARVPIGEVGRGVTPYPFILILGQDDNETIMGEKLTALGGHVDWNTELVGLDQHADSVTAELKLPDGTQRTIRARWVAGCDGAHSAVRHLNGIDFPGAPYEHVFFVADTEVTGSMVPDEVNIYLFRDGFHLLFPMRGKDHWRIVGIVPPELRDRKDLQFEAVLPSLRNEAGAGLAIKNCSWFSTYRIHHRAASHFREGRCFILGDAAHIHSPVGAQGMNTGLQDAYNLAWKLALVAQGKARDGLLDSYGAERVPVAKRLLATTDRAFKLVVADNWVAGLLRSTILARLASFVLGLPFMRRVAFRVVSQTGIGYRGSSLSQSLGGLPSGAPQPGDRFPWLRLRWQVGAPVKGLFEVIDDTRFNLLLFGQRPGGSADLGLGDMLRVHEVPGGTENDAELAQAGIPLPSFFLLRPDGHIGLSGAGLDGQSVKRYLAERLHLIV